MAYDMMDDESSPSTAESAPETKDNKSEETEDNLALVPKAFFKDEPKPGMREMVEVVEVYEGEVSIKCVYGDKDEDEEEGMHRMDGKMMRDSEMGGEEDSMMS